MRAVTLLFEDMRYWGDRCGLFNDGPTEFGPAVAASTIIYKDKSQHKSNNNNDDDDDGNGVLR